MDSPDTSEDEKDGVRNGVVVANALLVPGVGAGALAFRSHHDGVIFPEEKLERRTSNHDFSVARGLVCSCHNSSCRAEVEAHKLRIENERLREEISHLEGVIRVQLSEQDQEIKRQSAEVKTLSQLNEKLSQQLLLYRVAVAVLTMDERCNYYMK